jgi:hypothetical protein
MDKPAAFEFGNMETTVIPAPAASVSNGNK